MALLPTYWLFYGRCWSFVSLVTRHHVQQCCMLWRAFNSEAGPLPLRLPPSISRTALSQLYRNSTLYNKSLKCYKCVTLTAIFIWILLSPEFVIQIFPRTGPNQSLCEHKTADKLNGYIFDGTPTISPSVVGYDDDDLSDPFDLSFTV